MLRAKEKVEYIALTFCKVSKISDLFPALAPPPPPPKRNSILCQEPQQGQHLLCVECCSRRILQSFIKHVGVFCVLGIVPDAWAAEIQVAILKEVLSSMERGPKLEDFILKREYRERTPIGAPAVYSHVPRHIIYLVTLSILESEEKSHNFPKILSPSTFQIMGKYCLNHSF